MASSRFNDPIEPMDLANMRQKGMRSLLIQCRLCPFAQTTAPQKFIFQRLATSFRAGSCLKKTRPRIAAMNDAPRTVPYYINEAKSDMRGIKSGWYAIDEDGNLVFGPFDTYDQCVERDIRPTYLM
jgi:hypothetical protein